MQDFPAAAVAEEVDLILPGTRVIRKTMGVWGSVYSKFKRERKENYNLDV